VLPPSTVGDPIVNRSGGRICDSFSIHPFYPQDSSEVKTPRCPNACCSKTAPVIRHGFYKTKSARRRRYRCRECGRTFCSTTATPYHRLQHRRATFDEVAALSVEGASKSAIARVKGIAWNTVDRWLEKAAAWRRRFNDRSVNGLDVPELQADEIRTIVGGKASPAWIFTTLDVWSRLWLSARQSVTTIYTFVDGTPSPTWPPRPAAVTVMSIDFNRSAGMIGESLSRHEHDDDMIIGSDTWFRRAAIFNWRLDTAFPVRRREIGYGRRGERLSRPISQKGRKMRCVARSSCFAVATRSPWRCCVS